MIRSYQVSVDTTGGAGVSAGTGHVQFEGKILAVILRPHASAPATMDTTVTITENGDSTVDIETVATFTNIGSAAGTTKRYPRREVDDGAGASIAAANKSNVFTEFVTSTGIEVTVAQSNDLTGSAVIEVVVEQ
jgi:hypothetical protein